MPAVTVLQATDVEPVVNDQTDLVVRPLLGDQTGFDLFAQAVLERAPGDSRTIAVGDVDETLFVLSGHGELRAGGHRHALEPETAVLLPPGTEFSLHAPGPETLTLVAVRIKDPVTDGDAAPAPAPAVRRLADQSTGQATTQREFRILFDPSSGLRTATHFVGYIPTARAPDHFHTYDEVIYVLDGIGVMRAGGEQWPLVAGSSIQLPARTVHCVENTGDSPMRVVAVFRPGGSPAEAYYPDGTPAYAGGNS
jgi:quercetin dioxygenase-like cupin family protein